MEYPFSFPLLLLWTCDWSVYFSSIFSVFGHMDIYNLFQGNGGIMMVNDGVIKGNCLRVLSHKPSKVDKKLPFENLCEVASKRRCICSHLGLRHKA